MSKNVLRFGLLGLFLVLGLVLVRAAIVGSGNSNINVIVGSGSFLSSNCSSGSAFTGIAAGGAFICNPFVFSISQGVGLLFNPNPLTQSGVISLQNATELTIGGVNVRNCTGNGHISGFFGNMTPICSINNGNGTVTSISQAEGITLNPNPITSTGVVLLNNATNTTLGGIRLANCTGNDRFSGFNASLNPICSSTASGSAVEITIYEGLSSNQTPITSNATLVLNNATELTIGGTRVRNCSSGFHITGYFGNMTPICTGELNNGTVTSIDNAEGISVNPDPITGTGVVLLNNATTSTIGGTRVLNCSGNGHVSGWDGSMNPFCSANNGNGTVTSIASGSGITLNPDPITSTGTVMATNATLTVLGVTKLTNCSAGFYLNGWNATNIPNCVGELNNGSVTSISEGEGIMANPNPIVGVGNILLRNATELLLGGIKVRNCSSTQGITGWLANLTGICSDLGGAGLGIKQLTFGVGVSGNESPLLNNGTIFLKNASSTELGGVLASNCTVLESFTGITGGGAHVCTTNGFGRGIRQLTWIGNVWNVNESPTYTNASVMLNNASTTDVGLTRVTNCSAGQFVQGWNGGSTPICGIPSAGTLNISTQLLYSNHTEFNLTASGDCYRYTLPANQFDQIYVQAWADMYGTTLTPANWNMTINFSNTEKVRMPARSAAIAASYNVIPLSMSYNESSSASQDIVMRGVEVEDSGSFICKGMSVWGVNNASFVTRDHGNPYCNPLSGEYCKFYDFGGGDVGNVNNPSSILFDVSTYNSCSVGTGYDHIRRSLGQRGLGACPEGFLEVGLGNTASNAVMLLFKSAVSGNFVTGAYCNVGATDIPYNCSKTINTSNILEMSVRFSNFNLSSNGCTTCNEGSSDNVTFMIGYFMKNDTFSTTQANWTSNGLQNLIAFYHYRNETNWSAVTMLGGNASNQTTVLPLDFNSTATNFNAFNTFKIVRENSTSNMLFYINTSLVANHSAFIPDWTAFSGVFMVRHNTTAPSTNFKWLMLDWMKYYHTRGSGVNGNFVESYP